MFPPIVIGLAAVACLLLALGIGLWAYGQRQAESKAQSAHMQRTIERRMLAAAGNANPAGGMLTWQAEALQAKPVYWQSWLSVIGAQARGISRKAVVGLMAVGLVVFLLAWLKAGASMAVMAVLIFALGNTFFFWKKRENKRKKMLEQLPGFLDNMVRLITIGTSPHAAFQMSVDSVPQPLGDALQQASAVLSASSNLGYAMEQLEDSWRLPEFGLLAAVFRMSTKYGGRADLVLERVAAYIRDKHSAERELHAMSAEVRLSAWVLSLLPIVVGGLIMFVNDGYFLRMWNDESGRRMIMLAAGLEVVGVALLYRLARLR
ncbi:type II secretion system F family protein [Comamonas sp. NoAH]|uniref:type II secretion system F family protein n=1 Tax=Comamonas halotolerans TaxID=3041496 RepID=UPI0024E0D16F|nr:type II secretion system F family protein [Comamonas sp. NoAH]